jgi:hypothetical protein
MRHGGAFQFRYFAVKKKGNADDCFAADIRQQYVTSNHSDQQQWQ